MAFQANNLFTQHLTTKNSDLITTDIIDSGMTIINNSGLGVNGFSSVVLEAKLTTPNARLQMINNTYNGETSSVEMDIEVLPQSITLKRTETVDSFTTSYYPFILDAGDPTVPYLTLRGAPGVSAEITGDTIGNLALTSSSGLITMNGRHIDTGSQAIIGSSGTATFTTSFPPDKPPTVMLTVNGSGGLIEIVATDGLLTDGGGFYVGFNWISQYGSSTTLNWLAY